MVAYNYMAQNLIIHKQHIITINEKDYSIPRNHPWN